MKTTQNKILNNDELKNIQGVIISGYPALKHSAYMFLHFDLPDQAKPWLNGLINDITTAGWEKGKPKTALNIAFTSDGIDLFKTGAYGFSEEFTDGMSEVNRSRRLGDEGGSAPKYWEIGDQKLHALLMVQAPDKQTLDLLVKHYSLYNNCFSISPTVPVQFGYMPDDNKEHFGFADSISQPFIENSPAKKSSTETSVKAGEFILGYTNEYGQLPPTPVAPAFSDGQNYLTPISSSRGEIDCYKDFGHNGSYLVFRKLGQNVPAFTSYLETQVSDPDERKLMSAKCVGRWPGGAPLISSPDKDDEDLKASNDFGYGYDPHGKTCPVGSHIRRANPRDSLREDPEESKKIINRHRLLRRGVLYGKPFENCCPDDGDRGIFFICINADIRRQFEFVQQNWINNPKFGDLYDERDPIVGNNQDPGLTNGIDYFITIAGDSMRKRYKQLPRFVTVKGGGYFFLPSIPALRFLADQSNPDSKKRLFNILHPLETLERNEPQLIKSLTRMLGQRMQEVYKAGATKRDAHPKTLGLLKAEFVIENNLPESLKAGIFSQPKTYEAWLRMSSSNPKISADDKKDLRGFSIKLIGVDQNEYAEDEHHTQDFILMSVPVMAIGTIKLFRDAIYYLHKWSGLVWLAKLLFTGKIGVAIEFNKGRSCPTSPLDIRYWSTTPYQFGKKVVKYSVSPTSVHTSQFAKKRGEHYLTENMEKHLSAHEASFDFMVQFYQNPLSTPVENARYRWEEENNPFIKVATIIIPAQEFNTQERGELAERLSFSPNHTSPGLKPLGGLNRARIAIYNSLSVFRHERDGKPQVEHSAVHYRSIK